MNPLGRFGISTTAPYSGNWSRSKWSWPRLEEKLPGIGLELNLRKCGLVSSCGRAELSCFPHLAEVSHVDIRDENQGFKALGVPMGQQALEESREGRNSFFKGPFFKRPRDSFSCDSAVVLAAWCSYFAQWTPKIRLAWSKPSINRSWSPR